MKHISIFLLSVCFCGTGSNLFAGNPPDTTSITCRVRTEIFQPIEGVSVQLFAPAIPVDVTQLTDEMGTVFFEPLPDSTDFSLSCSKNSGVANGVTTLDMILISRHILGIEPFSSPYKLIAADANRSGSVTGFDLIVIRDLILGLITEFPNNTSWRFLPSDYIFPNPNNPFQGPLTNAGTYTAPVLLPIDITGIKVGDVNNTADPLALTTIDERELKTLFFETSHKKVQAGEEFIATFSSMEQAEGFQFTLHAEGLDILEVLPGTGISMEQFAVFPTQNALTVACETGGKARFALRLKSQRSGELSDMLRLSSEITTAEAYLPAPANEQPEIASVALGFREAGDVFQLHQNVPNPAAGQTGISFSLPSEMETSLIIFDSAGRTVYSKSYTYEKGKHTLQIDLSGIAPGVLFYQLQAEGYCAIRKMLRI